MKENIYNIINEIREKIKNNPKYLHPCNKEFQEDIKRFEFKNGNEFISFLKQNGILKNDTDIHSMVNKPVIHKGNKIKEKFMQNVDKNGPNGCHIWKGSVIPISGYGRMKIDGKTIRAHRLAYMLFKGPVSEDKIIMHKCNNRLCVNPDHLKEGTNAENSQQMVDEGRQICGNAKLKEDVSKIRELYNTGNYGYENLAETFNVTKGAIALIIRNENWKDDNYKRMYITKIGRIRKPKITKEQENEIKERYHIGMSQRQLSKDYGISKGLVYNILHNKTNYEIVTETK